MIQITWKLKPYLEQNAITPHKLALEAGISPPNLYTLIRGEGAKNVSRATLAKLIGALTRLTGQPVTPNDLLEVTEKPEQPSANLASNVEANLKDASHALHAAESTVRHAELQTWLTATRNAVNPLRGDRAKA